MKWLNRMPWLTLGMLLLIAGCGGSGGDSDPGRFDPQIYDAYDRLILAIEDESLNALEPLVSEDYLQDGTNDEGFFTIYDNFFRDYNNIDMDVDILDIDYDDDDSPEEAFVIFRQTIIADRVSTGNRETVDNATREMLWAFEDGRWKMYGNGETSAASAQSLRSAPAQSLLGNPKGHSPRHFRRSGKN